MAATARARGRTKATRRRQRVVRDPFILYTASVQTADAEVDFLDKVYRRRNAGRRPALLREDFCATAAIACEFVRRRPENRAWGVDLDQPTLEWGRARNVARLGEAAARVELVNDDVRAVREPKIDAVLALNFSYWVFTERATMIEYFRGVRDSLRPGGVLIIDAFGGTEAVQVITEKRRIPAQRGPNGERIPAFTYVWEQASFNPVDHAIVCHIHFRLGDGTTLRRAFTYRWRLWTLPELREMLAEAGFAASEVWMDGWDRKAEEGDGHFRPRKRFDNDLGWIAYVTGYR